jgi:hypothetical protein
MTRNRLLSLAVRSALCLPFACFLTTCDDPYHVPDKTNAKLESAGLIMDKLQSAAAEFGTMAVSTPVLANPDSAFQFNISATANDFYKDAQSSRQGGVSESEQQILDIEEQFSAGLSTGGASTTQPATQPSTSIGDLANAVQNFQKQYPLAAQSPLSVTDRTALVTAAGDNAVKAMFQLLGNPNLASEFNGKSILFGVSTISVNPGWRTHSGYAANVALRCTYRWVPARASVVQQFVDDVTVPPEIRHDIVQSYQNAVSSNPNAVQFIPRDEIYENFVNKNVNPPTTQRSQDIDFGTYGLKNYLLQHDAINLNPKPDPSQEKGDQGNSPTKSPAPSSLDDQTDNLSYLTRNGPIVAAISPLTDTQTLDLQSSFLKQQQLALNFLISVTTATHGNFNSDTVINYIKSLQQQFSTVNPNVVANAYSAGPVFGFQIGPSLKAIQDAKANKASGPADILDRQSFPALIIFGIDAAEIHPKVQWTKDGYRLYEPQLHVESMNQWMPTRDYDEKFWGRRFPPLKWMNEIVHVDSPLLKESDKLELSSAMDDAKQEVEFAYRNPYTTPSQFKGSLSFGPSDPSFAFVVGPTATSSPIEYRQIHDSTYIMFEERMQTLRGEIFGEWADLYLPRDVISSSLTGVSINSIKAAGNLALNQPADITLIGQGLENIDLSKISVANGQASISPPSTQTITTDALQATSKDAMQLYAQLAEIQKEEISIDAAGAPRLAQDTGKALVGSLQMRKDATTLSTSIGQDLTAYADVMEKLDTDAHGNQTVAKIIEDLNALDQSSAMLAAHALGAANLSDDQKVIASAVSKQTAALSKADATTQISAQTIPELEAVLTHARKMNNDANAPGSLLTDVSNHAEEIINKTEPIMEKISLVRTAGLKNPPDMSQITSNALSLSDLSVLVQEVSTLANDAVQAGGEAMIVSNTSKISDNAQGPTLSADKTQITLKLTVTKSPVTLRLLTSSGQPVFSPPLAIVAAPAPLPAPANLSVISPNIVELDTDGKGTAIPREVTFVVTGDNLDQIDTKKIAVTNAAGSIDLASVQLIGPTASADSTAASPSTPAASKTAPGFAAALRFDATINVPATPNTANITITFPQKAPTPGSPQAAVAPATSPTPVTLTIPVVVISRPPVRTELRPEPYWPK